MKLSTRHAQYIDMLSTLGCTDKVYFLVSLNRSTRLNMSFCLVCIRADDKYSEISRDYEVKASKIVQLPLPIFQ